MVDQPSKRGSLPPRSAGHSAPALDSIDNRIVEELTRDGRMSIRSIATTVNISRTNAYARVDRLIEEGVITGFSARISPRRAGFGTSAFVGLSIEQNAWREVAQKLAQTRYVEHVTLLAGDFDVLALVRTEDNSALRDLVFNELQSLKGVTGTRTWLIFDEFDGSHPPSG